MTHFVNKKFLYSVLTVFAILALAVNCLAQGYYVDLYLSFVGELKTSGRNLPHQTNGGDSDFYITSCDSKLYLQGDLTADDIRERETYYINHDICVDSGTTLTIPAGTQLFFTGNYSFDVYGTLIAQGTEEDSIKFMPAPGSGIQWQGITLYAGSSSNFVYCQISGCETAISSEGPDVNLNDCLITNVNNGI